MRKGSADRVFYRIARIKLHRTVNIVDVEREVFMVLTERKCFTALFCRDKPFLFINYIIFHTIAKLETTCSWSFLSNNRIKLCIVL